MESKEKIFEKIEKDLLIALLDYAVPFLTKKIKTPKRKNNFNLEKIVLNSRPKIGLDDFRELENSLLKNFNGQSAGSKSRSASLGSISYSIAMARKKIPDAKNYSVSIKYEENETKEKLK